MARDIVVTSTEYKYTVRPNICQGKLILDNGSRMYGNDGGYLASDEEVPDQFFRCRSTAIPNLTHAYRSSYLSFLPIPSFYFPCQRFGGTPGRPTQSNLSNQQWWLLSLSSHWTQIWSCLGQSAWIREMRKERAEITVETGTQIYINAGKKWSWGDKTLREDQSLHQP